MTDALVVGNNLAVLVAAAELGAAGQDVVLVTDGRAPGGHFRGLRLPEADLDLGMVLLESGGPAGAEADPVDYRPRVRYDWRRFGALVDRWQHEHVQLVGTPTPEALVEGRRRPDHLIADRLDVLTEGFSAPEAVRRDDPRHAAGKVTSPAYDDLRYVEAAELNHGKDIQARLIDPFAEKLLGPAYDSLLARYHRAGWLPLYWSETLAAACEGRPTGLPEYPFWSTAGGFVGDVVRSLERRLEGMPNVRVCDATVTSIARGNGQWTVGAESESWSHARPVLGLVADRVQSLLGLPTSERSPGASVLLLCCLVRGSAISAPVGCLSVVDREFAAYRVTDQDALAGLDPEWHRVVVEAGPASVARHRDGADVAGELVAELRRLLGVEPGGDDDVRILKALAAPGAVPVPTSRSVAAEIAAADAVAEACPEALLTGALLGGGATSMNDQVVQGLAVAAQLR